MSHAPIPARRQRLLGAGVLVAGVVAALAFGLLSSAMTPVCAACKERMPLRSDWHVGAPAPVDIGFCQDMAAHHDQAVLMAALAQDRAGPAVKALASSILVGQSQETGIMRGWLQLWNQPMLDGSPMAWMSDTAANQTVAGTVKPAKFCRVPRPGAMPGMASPQQLNRLWQTAGEAFDILFLQLMIRHHQGGLLMSRDAQLHASLEVVRNTARVMIVQQVQEIAEMRRLLQADGAQPLPSPE